MTLGKILVSVVACFVAASCGRSTSRPNSGVEKVQETIQVIPPQAVVHDLCVTLPLEPESTEVESESSEIGVALRDLPLDADLEWAILDQFNKKISSKRLCTSMASALLVQVDEQHAGARLVLRERISNRLFVIDDLKLRPGQRINYGQLSGSSGQSIQGTIESGQSLPNLSGEITELGWKLSFSSDGSWTSGALPQGEWSVVISAANGKTARWTRTLLYNSSVQLGSAQLTDSEFLIAPLWTGNLKQKDATLLLSAPPDVVEVRLSLNPQFPDTFWQPFSQVIYFPITNQGQNTVYAQFRHLSGKLSGIYPTAFYSETLDLSETAEAIVSNPTLSVFEPSTTIETTPPALATEHSLTVDVENLPRLWTPVSQPLALSFSRTLESCGSHTVYIRFRTADKVESNSLTRTVHVKCWEKNLPPAPLAPRYGHAAVPIKLHADSESNDSAFIWGGRNESQVFNDGAIITQRNGSWEWDSVPAPPATFAPRHSPKITASQKHIFIFGGENLSGEPVPGWAFYNFKTQSWKTDADYSPTGSNVEVPLLQHSSVGFVTDLVNPSGKGMFIVVGGEKTEASGIKTISEKYYVLFEFSGDGVNMPTDELPLAWFSFDAPLGISRATSVHGSHSGFFFVHSGVIAPTGTSSPDSSGLDFDLTADLLSFSFATDQETGSTSLFHRRYQTQSSRTGALNGHAFVLMREQPGKSSYTIDELIEDQSVCVFGATKFSDALPQICEGLDADGKVKLHQPFCRRIYDSYLFAPTGKLGLCFEPKRAENGSDTGHLGNFTLALERAPRERKLDPESTVGINSRSFSGGLFLWSGLSPTGGEYLSDGAFFFANNNKWVPVTQFQAPAPRYKHTASFIREHNRILIWGGKTAAGLSAEGAFYAVPEN